jgi:hypothetical protein
LDRARDTTSDTPRSAKVVDIGELLLAAPSGGRAAVGRFD